ncbi:MAG: hypothetical protein JXA01_06495 [Dehalococcoidia bacterium]|nr:hypothetical protein [Dehalococcoidia bacterium]
MINITDDAKKELKKMLSENAPDPSVLLRLAANEQGQLGLVMDKQMEGDSVLEYEGTKLMVIEDQLAVHLEGISLEVENTPEGPSLMLTQTGCGGGCCCGGEHDLHDESDCGGGSCCGGEKPC